MKNKKAELLLSALKISLHDIYLAALKMRLAKRAEIRTKKNKGLSDRKTVRLSEKCKNAAKKRKAEEKRFFELMKNFR